MSTKALHHRGGNMGGRVLKLILTAAIAVAAGLPRACALDALNDSDTQVRWTAGFSESGVGSFDHLRVEWLSGTTFAPPFFMNFSVRPQGAPTSDSGGWATASGGLRDAAAASAAATDRLAFEVVFSQPQNNPLRFLFHAWQGDTLRDLARVDWSGTRWDFAAVGACCLGADCQLSTETECADLGGRFQGIGTDCDPSLCMGATTAAFSSWGWVKSVYR
jgi:hypothetical protein